MRLRKMFWVCLSFTILCYISYKHWTLPISAPHPVYNMAAPAPLFPNANHYNNGPDIRRPVDALALLMDGRPSPLPFLNNAQLVESHPTPPFMSPAPSSTLLSNSSRVNNNIIEELYGTPKKPRSFKQWEDAARDNTGRVKEYGSPAPLVWVCIATFVFRDRRLMEIN